MINPKAKTGGHLAGIPRLLRQMADTGKLAP
jgi:hypothetical protein